MIKSIGSQKKRKQVQMFSANRVASNTRTCTPPYTSVLLRRKEPRSPKASSVPVVLRNPQSVFPRFRREKHTGVFFFF